MKKTLILLACLTLIGCASTNSNYKVTNTENDIPEPAEPDSEMNTAVYQLIHYKLGEEEGYDIIQDGEKHAYVNNIVNKLVVAAGGQADQYPVYIADAGDNINAMAIADNSIVVYTKLLERSQSEDQLAAILGHELAHVLAKHSSDDTESKRRKGLETGGMILGAIVGIAATYAGYGEVMGTAADVTTAATTVIGEGAFVRSYSRKLEGDADHIGMLLMAKACFQPEAAVEFWENSEEIFGEESKNSFFSSHPSDQKRAKNLKKLLPHAKALYQENCDTSQNLATIVE